MLKLYLARTSLYKEEMLSSLDEDELVKANTFKKEDDKKRYVISRNLLKYVLKNNRITDYELVYNEFGKPFLKDNKAYFNLSHTHDFVVCAFSDNLVGVDIERIRPKNDLVIKRCYTSNEALVCVDDLMFTKIWTLKESYIKYLGTGLKTKLNSFETVKDYALCKIDNVIFTSMKIDDYYLSICHKPTKHFKIKYVTIF